MDIELAGADLKAVLNRLRRAQDQTSGVIRMIEEGRDCEEVVMQFSAASRAPDRAGFAIIATGLQHCATDIESGRKDGKYTGRMRDRLEKLFLSLA